MATINLRPDNKHANQVSDWWTNGANVWTAAADQSTSTKIKKLNSSESYLFTLANISSQVPAGSTINWIKVWMQNKYRDDGAASSAEASVAFDPSLGSYYANRADRPSGSGQTIYTDGGSQISAKIAGGAFTLAELDTALISLYSVGQTNVADSPVSHVFYDVWLEVNYTTHQNPSTPTSLQRTGAESDVTPAFSAVVTDPDGNTVKARFEIYLSDGTTLVGSVDSAFVASGATATAEYTSTLTVGSYKVKAKAIDNEGMSSGYTALISFDVTQTLTKDLNVLWDVMVLVPKDLALVWDVQANNLKDFTFLWDVTLLVDPVDLELSWDVKTPWTRPEEQDVTWTKVGEL